MEQVVIVADSREQEPYAFAGERVTTVRRALVAGDYSLEGWEQAVAVERKTLEDFVSTVIRDRDRFHRELRILAEYEAACVVVEAGLREVLEGHFLSGAHPNAVLGAALSIIVDFQVPVFFCSDRQAACRFVEGFLLRFHRKATDSCPPEPKSTAPENEAG